MGTPTESPRETQLRSRVVFSFWVVVVLLGIPMWWKTTSIYRASLPINQMSEPIKREENQKIIEKLPEGERPAAVHLMRSQGYDVELTEGVIRSLTPEIVQSIERSAVRAFKPSPAYHLTFSLLTAGASPSAWDIQPALQQYIDPLVHALSPAASFSIATQIQAYSTLAPSVQPYNSEGGWMLKQSDLASFINTAEWPLSPSVGSGPTINFLLYVPSRDQTPLKIEGRQANSWLIPQWGGIAILNPELVRDPDLDTDHIPHEFDIQTLQPTFEIFQNQLLQLLGVPENPPSLPARLEAFKRLASLALYLRTKSNLGSLARLAERLSNIPIPKHVLQLVENSLEGLHNYVNGDMSSSRNAYESSEKAFFDKAMVGQAYFPDEHKVAVYLPLLGPVGVSLAVGLIREMKRLAAQR